MEDKKSWHSNELWAEEIETLKANNKTEDCETYKKQLEEKNAEIIRSKTLFNSQNRLMMKNANTAKMIEAPKTTNLNR